MILSAAYHIPECDVYLHSVYTLDYSEQLGIVRSLRERYPKFKHIAGGPHAVEFQDECLKTQREVVVAWLFHRRRRQVQGGVGCGTALPKTEPEPRSGKDPRPEGLPQ